MRAERETRQDRGMEGRDAPWEVCEKWRTRYVEGGM